MIFFDKKKINFNVKWLYFFLAIYYLKQVFTIDQTFILLGLDEVVYTPFILIFWFFTSFFWSLFFEEKYIIKFIPTVFVLSLFIAPIAIFIKTKNFGLLLTFFLSAIQPLKNKILKYDQEKKANFVNFLIIFVGFFLLVISKIVSSFLNLANPSFIFGLSYYFILFWLKNKFDFT